MMTNIVLNIENFHLNNVIWHIFNAKVQSNVFIDHFYAMECMIAAIDRMKNTVHQIVMQLFTRPWYLLELFTFISHYALSSSTFNHIKCSIINYLKNHILILLNIAKIFHWSNYFSIIDFRRVSYYWKAQKFAIILNSINIFITHNYFIFIICLIKEQINNS